MIYYKNEHPELSASLTGFQSQEYISTLQFADTVNIFSNGYNDNSYSLTWDGEMANERIADMLPYDFMPDGTRIDRSDYAEILTPIEKYLLTEQDSRSKDQVFVQLDRNMYKSGDTIYFQAYVRNRFTSEFETNSVSLYAILFDDRQKTIDSSRFKIGRAHV